jgi:hypothetical protein
MLTGFWWPRQVGGRSTSFRGDVMRLLGQRRSRVIIALLAVLSLLIGACQGPYPNAIVDSNGDPISLDKIQAVLDDTSLNDDEKKDELRALGITDEDLLNFLVFSL